MKFRTMSETKKEESITIEPPVAEMLRIINDNLGAIIALQRFQIRLFAAYVAQDRQTLESLWKEMEALL